MNANANAPHVSTDGAVSVLHLYPQSLIHGLVLSTALASPRSPLTTIRPEERPGVYILFARAGAKSLAQYGTDICSATFPIYVGSAQLLPARLSRHRKTIASASGLSVHDFFASVIYTDSLAAALAVEQTLIKEIRPPWNERALSGFGSAPRGATRAAECVSGFDCLHRRNWAAAPSAKERATARAALRLFLRSGYVRPLWQAL